jgi:hypothetical protein
VKSLLNRWLRTGHRPMLASLRRPSPAMIVALVALFVSLSGVSYGVATGFIDSREIKNNEVRSIDIRNNEIRTKDLRNNEIRGIDIRNSTIQGRDIGVNTITGVDIKEDTLQQVPSALLADSATKADSAGSLDDFKIVDTTMATGAPQVTLATNGSLTLLGRCVNSVSQTSDAILVDTSEDNTIVASDSLPNDDDLDASEPAVPVASAVDSSGGNRSASMAFFHATAPSGPAFVGHFSIQAEATSTTAGSCRFQGLVALPG